ncbi:MAG: hemoglobin [Bacteroidetes bacterium]|nr:hemoglobin [Bacteroidota bacterium]
MSLSRQQIQGIKNSWKSLRGIRPELIADIFYSKLFTDNPRLRKMFPADMKQQYMKLMDMLNSIVLRLDNPGQMDDEIKAMAARHAGYGVKTAHYKQVGDALLWTLKQGLGDSWNTEVESAWIACYDLLAAAMSGRSQ